MASDMEIVNQGRNFALLFLILKMSFVLFLLYSKKGAPKCYLSSDGGDSWTGESSDTCRVHRLLAYRARVFAHVVMMMMAAILVSCPEQ